MKSNNSHYNKNLKGFARELRNESTLGEILLWDKVLKAKGTGYQFNRQFPMTIDEGYNIIVDFICRKLKLIIEIDGSSHMLKGKEDAIRDEKLEALGYRVLRVTEQEVRHAIDTVVQDIETMIDVINEENSKK